MPYKLLAVSLFVCLVMAIGWYLSHQEVLAQSRTIDNLKGQVALLDKQVASREKSSVSLKIAKDRAYAERDMYKRKLDETEDGSECRDVPLGGDTKRVLEELYGSQPSE